MSFLRPLWRYFFPKPGRCAWCGEAAPSGRLECVNCFPDNGG